MGNDFDKAAKALIEGKEQKP